MSTEAETTSATATVATPTKATAPAADAVTDAAGTAPATGSAPSTPSKETDEARMQLVQGRRHLLVKDYFSAVAALAKGCELLAQKYGDTAPELGDAYFTYGRALLELARSESGVLGMNEDGEGEGEDEDEGGEDGEDDEEEADGDGEEGADGADGAELNGKDAAAEEKKDDAAPAVEAVTSNGASETNGKAEANGTEEKKTNGVKENGKEVDTDQTLKEDEEEEDVNNLQLAWEILELAKTIFTKQIETEKEEADQKQNSLKLAEVHLKLGEVGVESENYSTAVEDMKVCLELQKKYLDEDDRRIAETLYNMGMAYSLANEFDSAIDNFKSASKQIEMRIVNLEKKKAEPVSENKDVSDDPFYTVEGEIEELKTLLPEIKEKVSDMQDFKKETLKRMMDGLAEASAKQSSTADGAGPSSASDKPVSNVAHLVKRKPKEENSTSQVTEESKSEDKQDKKEDEKDKMVEKRESSTERKRKQEDAVDSEDATKKVKVDDDPETKSVQ